jgi:hypothetical protein
MMLDSKLLLFLLLNVHDKIRISIIMHLVVEPAYVLRVVFEMSIIQYGNILKLYFVGCHPNACLIIVGCLWVHGTFRWLWSILNPR